VIRERRLFMTGCMSNIHTKGFRFWQVREADNQKWGRGGWEDWVTNYRKALDFSWGWWEKKYPNFKSRISSPRRCYWKSTRSRGVKSSQQFGKCTKTFVLVHFCKLLIDNSSKRAWGLLDLNYGANNVVCTTKKRELYNFCIIFFLPSCMDEAAEPPWPHFGGPNPLLRVRG
jgi:hypothetical protein